MTDWNLHPESGRSQRTPRRPFLWFRRWRTAPRWDEFIQPDPTAAVSVAPLPMARTVTRSWWPRLAAWFRHGADYETCPCDSCTERRLLESSGGG